MKAFVCSRVEDGPCAVDGAIVDECCVCEEAVWVCPATLKVQEKHKDLEFTKLCSHCFAEKVAKEGVQEVTVETETLEEAQETIKKFLKNKTRLS